MTIMGMMKDLRWWESIYKIDSEKKYVGIYFEQSNITYVTIRSEILLSYASFLNALVSIDIMLYVRPS
jgi:hypothetical protein